MFGFLTQPMSMMPVVAAKLNDNRVMHLQENIGSVTFAARHGYTLTTACGHKVCPSTINFFCVGQQYEVLLPTHILPS
jgi:hypothetical protein